MRPRIPPAVPMLLALAAGCASPGEEAAAPESPAVASAPAAPQPYAPPVPLRIPVAPMGDQVDDYHGTKVADPYRWLEDLDSEATRAWVEAENRLTFSFLEGIPEREVLRARLTELWNFERFGIPRVEGGRTFYTRNDGLQDQSVLLVSDGAGAAPRLLIDPNGLSMDGTVALSDWSPSRDGTRLAYALSSAGSDWMEWRVMDVVTGEDLPDLVRWSKFSDASWAPDGSGFYYSRYDAPAEGEEFKGVLENQKLCFHRVGTPQSADPVIYERPDHPDWGFGGWVSDDERYALLYIWRGSESKNRLYYRDLAAEGGFVPLFDENDASYEFVGNDGPRFFVFTNRDAPRGRVVAVDLADPAPANWRTLIPEGPGTLESVNLVGGRFLAVTMKDARSEVRVHRLDGSLERVLELPGTGSASGFRGRPGDRETYFAYTDFVTPPSIHRLEIATGQSTVFARPEVPFDREAYETRQVFYESRDGTRVPMFLVHRRGLPLDGDRPVELYGYGGFNIPLTPWFSVANAVWMERGGVVAIPNIRGGGEYGEEWHRAAIRENRPRAFEDFIEAAEWLVARGYTRPGRLAISGGSNGGLLVGACMTRRPDLFGAALPAVGVLDMLRYHRFTIGRAWVPEFGSSDEPGDFAFLRAYSPLHNLVPGTAYPPTLITTADHDDRVFPAHSFKFAAALQAAQGGPGPILIRVETRAGHGAGTPTSKRIEQAADQLAFLVEVLGVR